MDTQKTTLATRRENHDLTSSGHHSEIAQLTGEQACKPHEA
jgi:hypothetical protein